MPAEAQTEEEWIVQCRDKNDLVLPADLCASFTAYWQSIIDSRAEAGLQRGHTPEEAQEYRERWTSAAMLDSNFLEKRMEDDYADITNYFENEAAEGVQFAAARVIAVLLEQIRRLEEGKK